MTGSASPDIDNIDCEILAELQENARIAFAELGRRVGLSTPAVIERVHRLEEKQVIVGYRTLVDPAKVGLPVRAFVKVTVAGDKLTKFSALVRKLPEVLQCHRVTASRADLPGHFSCVVQVDIRHRDGCPLAREFHREAFADTTASARNNRHLAADVRHDRSP